MNRNKKIAVYTGVQNNRRFWTMRPTRNTTMYGFWQVREYDGCEYIDFKLTWNTAIMAAPSMPADFWFVNQPTEKDFQAKIFKVSPLDKPLDL